MEKLKTFNSFIYLQMAFLESKHSSGKDREFLTAASTTIGKGDALVFSSGYLTPATASDYTSKPVVIASEDVSTGADAHKKILGLLVDPTMEFIVDCDDDLAQSQVGTLVKFKDKATLDNGTTGGFIQIIETLPWKKALVKFL